VIKKNLFVLLTVFVISWTSVFAYTKILINNRSDADMSNTVTTSTTVVPQDSPYLKATAVGATACHDGSPNCDLTNTQAPGSFPTSFPFSVPRSIGARAFGLLSSDLSNCFKTFVKKYPTPQTFPALPFTFTNQNCSIAVISKLDSSGNIYNISAISSFKGNIPGFFDSVFDRGKVTKSEGAPLQFDATLKLSKTQVVYNSGVWSYPIKDQGILGI